MATRRRKDLAASRRRVEDEGDEEGVLETGSLDDDSLSEGSIISEEDEAPEGDDVINVEIASAGSPDLAKVNGNGTIQAKDKTVPSNGISTSSKKPLNGTSDMEMMLNGLKISDQNGTAEDVQYEDLREDADIREQVPSPPVVKSTAQMDLPQELPHERRRREHEEYKKKRDADPAFVPNRGAFFMHDHRHSGPAANGFRPFGRGRGRGRPGIGGPYGPSSQMPPSFEPTDAPWAHDMHEVVISEPNPRHVPISAYSNGSSNLPSRVPISASAAAPPNRALSTTKHIGNVQIRVFLFNMEKPIVFPGIPVKQYTRLPDHRPPMRRDKPVRISIPDHPPRYIFPAVDRSFIFIPRAMRPNQQGFGGRGRGPRSAFGSIGGYSRRTSVFGGSVYGSAYTPSVAMSRRSSLAREVNREGILSPNGSAMSRPQMPLDSSRPVVKLPPPSQSVQPQQTQSAEGEQNDPPQAAVSIDTLPRPQTYPLPQKPTFRENRPNPIPMHQPRPQKAVSVADIESPATLSFNPPQQQHQQPFHQQVPIQVNGNNYSHDSMMHSRNPSYPSQASTGTPLSQIPERAIHAQPFQPNPYQQQPQNFYSQPYQVMPPPQGYYYPQSFNPSMPPPSGAPGFVPPQPQQQQAQFSQPSQQADNAAAQAGVQNLVAQEVNGMVYYYDAAQIPAVATFPAYQQPQSYPMPQVGGVVGMGGMMTPSPDGFYYPQAPQGVVYYPQ
ncbi:CASC3/Barentsz eIF4AIII binding-domain-containing protein [Tricladium varicosporioides]|nr:CASC3/Barentsz eIF4AIII binding-domain-containing protein [Hymenoscyphus varicosporioides]